MTTAATKEKQLTAEDIISEDTIRSYYLQPFMFYIHANIVINLLTWFVDYQYGWRLFEAEFNWARAGTLVIDFYWMYYFHRYLKNEGGKPPIQSDVTLLIISIGMSFILMHYMQWLFDLHDRTFHYSGLLGMFNFLAGLYYTHFYLASRVHWKNW